MSAASHNLATLDGCLQPVACCRDLEEARMVVHVLRELRRQKTRLEKRKLEGEATTTVRELSDLFPDLSDGVIRSRLRDRCSCVPFKVSPSRISILKNSYGPEASIFSI